LCILYEMHTEFDKVIADLYRLREDVREVHEDHKLELEIYRSDLRRQVCVKMFLVISAFINGLLIAYCANHSIVTTTFTGHRLL